MTNLSLPPLTSDDLSKIARTYLIELATIASLRAAGIRLPFNMTQTLDHIKTAAKNFCTVEGKVFNDTLLEQATADLIQKAGTVKLDSIQAILALYPET